MSPLLRAAACLFLLLSSSLFVTNATAKLVPGEIVLKVGDVVIDSTAVTALNSPFTNGLGQVGFVASLADAQRMIWNDGPTFFSGDALPVVLVGGEGSMGISDSSGFIYSPSADGDDAVYTHGGLLMKGTWPMPPLPGLFSTFNSRPTMVPAGYAYWIGGTATTSGGATSNRHLFKATAPGDSSSIVRVLGGGDVIEGKTVRTSASNFDFWISSNELHHIHVLDMNVTLNEHVYLDGGFVAQEGDSTGQGDIWSAFDIVGVNNAGNYIFTGDTNGPTATDEFVAYNGAIAVREGDTLDGVVIPTGSALRAASINNQDLVAHMWGTGTVEHFFIGDGASLGSSRHLASVGDTLDVDGDQVGDYVFSDFQASTTIGPGLDLGDDLYVYFETDLIPVGGGTAAEAIVRVHMDYASLVQDPTDSRAEGKLLLLAAGPNPSRHGSMIEFWMPQAAPVQVGVYDLMGREVRTLFRGRRDAGTHREAWDGRDAGGRTVAAGAYFIRLASGHEDLTRKVILLR